MRCSARPVPANGWMWTTSIPSIPASMSSWTTFSLTKRRRVREKRQSARCGDKRDRLARRDQVTSFSYAGLPNRGTLKTLLICCRSAFFHQRGCDVGTTDRSRARPAQDRSDCQRQMHPVQLPDDPLRPFPPFAPEKLEILLQALVPVIDEVPEDVYIGFPDDGCSVRRGDHDDPPGCGESRRLVRAPV